MDGVARVNERSTSEHEPSWEDAIQPVNHAVDQHLREAATGLEPPLILAAPVRALPGPFCFVQPSRYRMVERSRQRNSCRSRDPVPDRCRTVIHSWHGAGPMASRRADKESPGSVRDVGVTSRLSIWCWRSHSFGPIA